MDTNLSISLPCQGKIPLPLCSECDLIWVPLTLFTHNVCFEVEAHQLLEQHPRFRLVSASFWPCFTHFPFSAAIVPFQSCFPHFPFQLWNHALQLCSGSSFQADNSVLKNVLHVMPETILHLLGAK